ncbi:MAG: DUF3040 domain-containing protein [Actinophytocola sp.]|uniref:DUF3040 domain-containing protein n=1 Tax=Actinophytocola sp. TaxID=1872138 RepID=UPI001324A546|nr:DUF3040 domain-containing protein [Actinophytocola sp.]MPZ85353.1 DUF3040 domain-containing protein [Actinophytocola sp.]
MGLQDHEKRELAEIEQRLVQDDPRLATRLASGKATMFTLSGQAQFILGVLTTYVTGLLTIIAGVTFASPFLITLGAAVTASFPVAVASRAWRHRQSRAAAGSQRLDGRDELAE